MGSQNLQNPQRMKAIRQSITQLVHQKIEGFNATQQEFVFIAPAACRLLSAKIVSDTGSATSTASNKWTLDLQNKAESNESLCSTPQATFQDAAVNEWVGNTAWDLAVDQNNDLDEGDVIELVITKGASATSMASAEFVIMAEYVLK